MRVKSNENVSTKGEKYLYYILISSVILYLIIRGLIRKEILNFPYAFSYLIFSISILYACISKRKYLLEICKSKKEIWKIMLDTAILLFKYVVTLSIIGLTCFLSIFLISNVTYVADKPFESLTVEIVHFSRGTSKSAASAQFYFDGKINSLPIKPETYQVLKKDSGNNAYLILQCRRGLLGSYVADNWEVQIK